MNLVDRVIAATQRALPSEEAAAHCDRILWLRDGGVVREERTQASPNISLEAAR